MHGFQSSQYSLGVGAMGSSGHGDGQGDGQLVGMFRTLALVFCTFVLVSSAIAKVLPAITQQRMTMIRVAMIITQPVHLLTALAGESGTGRGGGRGG